MAKESLSTTATVGDIEDIPSQELKETYRDDARTHHMHTFHIQPKSGRGEVAPGETGDISRTPPLTLACEHAHQCIQLDVRDLPGHRKIDDMLLYMQLVSFESDEFHVKTAKTLKDACELAEAGFEYFNAMDHVQIFRKRK